VYALLKDFDPKQPHGVLLVPFSPIAGMECACLREPGSINHFSETWKSALQSKFPDGTRPLDRADIALVVNSASSRGFDQLHTHIDCVQDNVKKTLAGQKLATSNPFSDLSNYLVNRNMGNIGDYSLGVIGEGTDGAYVLAGKNRGEALIDVGCDRALSGRQHQ
jgi:CDP-diacylglycerol pyrophosphatase